MEEKPRWATMTFIDTMLDEMWDHKCFLGDKLDHMKLCQKSYSISEIARTAEAHARLCESVYRLWQAKMREQLKPLEEELT